MGQADTLAVERTNLAEKRTKLAIERSRLANERTILSYFRTSLMVFLTAISFIKFFDSAYLIAVGFALIPISIVILIAGIYSYNRMKKVIRDSCEKIMFY